MQMNNKAFSKNVASDELLQMSINQKYPIF
jgi:hypothetical protein